MNKLVDAYQLTLTEDQARQLVMEVVALRHFVSPGIVSTPLLDRVLTELVPLFAQEAGE